MLADISLKGRGPTEDKMYAKRHQLMQNVRRGNTVVSNGKGDAWVGRKGLMKFFDLSLEFLEGHAKYAHLA